MHILLTDRLSCPRCGPAFGLILLADRIEERRVYEGVLGCPNCRDRFPIVDGFGDLRPPPRGDLLGATGGEADDTMERDPVEVGALLGVTGGPGQVALVGPVAVLAGALADLIDGVEVVAVAPAVRASEERAGVSRIVAGSGLPFFDRSMRGVALAGEVTQALLGEAIRVVTPGGRVLIFDPTAGLRLAFGSAGLDVVFEGDTAIVGTRVQ